MMPLTWASRMSMPAATPAYLVPTTPFARAYNQVLWWCAWVQYYRGPLVLGTAGVIIALLVGKHLWRRYRGQSPQTFGSSRWATRRDLKRSGLLAPEGVVVGRGRRRVLRHNGPQHVLV